MKKKYYFKYMVLGIAILGLFSLAVIYLGPASSDQLVEEFAEKELEQDIGIEVGQIAPDFNLTNLAGDEVSLSQFRGQNVILNFWASWCSYCREEMPDLDQFDAKYDDTIVLGVNVGEEKDVVKEFITDEGYQFLNLLDQASLVTGEYAVSALPTTYFIDQEGRIKYVKRGIVTKEELTELRRDLF
ncbi:TlpA family protein disulfide reductase [Natroniella sulfidigena]|uniref:TlpA family protein disulfide reductase n=1 Tax=Natroniella sulfidigena TaxID=723921 RepID=UPI00200AF8C0|nr:TlpA disulfide reductase family protein [Natroniella sulfidigena]MCK8816814.1 TlpA family protein disulfide reductase [Natroniella sulfidigena]